jgi:ABC-type oligopeptide transport system substrate-binding subunit
MTRTRTSALLAALVVLVVAVAGCGGSSSSSGTGSTTIAKGGANGQAPASGKVQGGNARFNLASDTDFVDPALAYYQVSWQFEYATCAKLINYPDRPGVAGSQLVPEVAAGFPKVSADGKTYTFTIRDGFTFSPPSNEPVTAKTFQFVINRVLNPKMQSPGAQFISDIVGASDVQSGKATSASGVVANGNTLTVHLTQKAPDFLARISMPFFCAVPTNTPIDSNGVGKVASAGPYYVASWIPKRTLVLKRNPNYHGTRPHNLDTITYTIGVAPEATNLQIRTGAADYAADGVPPAVNAQLGAKYGPGSPAAEAGHQQYFVNPTLSFRYLALNTTRPLFKDVNVRKAVNYAIDRHAILLQRGAYAGQAWTHYLPPGIAGSSSEQPYPTNTPDLATAKKLAGSGSKGTAVLYTCDQSPCPQQATIIQQNLKQIGINVDVKQFARAVQFSKEGTKGEPFDIAFEGWNADYADPYDFINVLLNGKSIQKANNVNFSYFNDPTYIKQMEQAAGLSGPERSAAYGKLDLNLAKNASPLAAWDVDNERDFFSARTGCQLYHPVYGMDIAALCLRK